MNIDDTIKAKADASDVLKQERSMGDAPKVTHDQLVEALEERVKTERRVNPETTTYPAESNRRVAQRRKS